MSRLYRARCAANARTVRYPSSVECRGSSPEHGPRHSAGPGRWRASGWTGYRRTFSSLSTSALLTIMPPKIMNSGNVGRSAPNSFRSCRPLKTCASTGRPPGLGSRQIGIVVGVLRARLELHDRMLLQVTQHRGPERRNCSRSRRGFARPPACRDSIRAASTSARASPSSMLKLPGIHSVPAAREVEPPTCAARSTSSTLRPSIAATSAAVIPAAPAPSTTTS